MENKSSIKIALVEDNAINRKTFMQQFKYLKNCTLVFVAQNGMECLDELKSLPLHVQPDIIFMDIEMPELNGIQTIAYGKDLYPQIRFIVLTVFDDDEKIFEAIKAGASGYLLKHESESVIEEAIQNIMNLEGAPMSPAIARKALQLLSRSQYQQGAKNNQLPPSISEREKDILQHMVNGWDAKRIAAALELSVCTVRKHIANIYEKLHVNSKAQVISLAHKNKWMQ